MPKYPDEEVLVVPRESLFGGPVPQGFGSEDLESLLARIEGAAAFRPRDEVEEDPSQKQIIPYILVRRGDEFLALRRAKKQSEARLHDKVSIGIGGHINRLEGDGSGVVRRGLERELNEELDLRGQYEVRPVGWLNDDSNAVGQVHFGLVFELDADRAQVAIRETEHMSGEFCAAEALAELYGAMETWSQIVFDHVVRKRRD